MPAPGHADDIARVGDGGNQHEYEAEQAYVLVLTARRQQGYPGDGERDGCQGDGRFFFPEKNHHDYGHEHRIQKVNGRGDAAGHMREAQKIEDGRHGIERAQKKQFAYIDETCAKGFTLEHEHKAYDETGKEKTIKEDGVHPQPGGHERESEQRNKTVARRSQQAIKKAPESVHGTAPVRSCADLL